MKSTNYLFQYVHLLFSVYFNTTIAIKPIFKHNFAHSSPLRKNDSFPVHIFGEIMKESQPKSLRK